MTRGRWEYHGYIGDDLGAWYRVELRERQVLLFTRSFDRTMISLVSIASDIRGYYVQCHADLSIQKRMRDSKISPPRPI